MTELLAFSGAAAGLAAALAALAVWSRRRAGAKWTALALAVALVPVGHLAFASLLGQPRPLPAERWRDALAGATVIGSDLREGEAIFLWVRDAGDAPPRAYRLPWSERLARELHRAGAEAERTGVPVKVRPRPGDPGAETEPVFYAEPQPAPPPKAVAAAAPVRW